MNADALSEVVNLEPVAIRFRSLLIETLQGLDYIPSPFAFFPSGSCGIASDMLGQILNDRLANQVMYVGGCGELGSHGWLRYGDIVIDVTGDQFPGRPAVFVGKADAWFDQWDVDEPLMPAEFTYRSDLTVIRIFDEISESIFA